LAVFLKKNEYFAILKRSSFLQFKCLNFFTTLDVRETFKELLKEDFDEFTSLNSPDYIEGLTVPIFDLPNEINATEYGVNEDSTSSGFQFQKQCNQTRNKFQKARSLKRIKILFYFI